MELIAIIIAIFIILFLLYKLVIYTLNKTNKNNTQSSKPYNPPKGDVTIYVPRGRVIINDDKNINWAEEAKKREFWKQASHYLMAYIEERDFESATEFVFNIWNTKDKAKYAKELHALLNFSIEKSYPVIYENNELFEFVYFLCDLDISNIANYAKIAPRNPDGLCYMFSFTKKAILLENTERIEEAIELCNIGIEYRVLDKGFKKDGYGSFERRKEHLIKKLKKKNYTVEDVFGNE